MNKDFVLISGRNEKIPITTYGFENIKSSFCLVYVHGFKGFKDWGFVPFLGNYFSKNGFFVITFNFSHNGVGDSFTEINEQEKFAKNTISLEIEELNEIIDAYLNDFFGAKAGKNIRLIGHSRGGAISLFVSSKRKEIGAVALWSSISKLDRYSERQKKEWRKKGVVEVLNKRTNQMMKLNATLLEDIENNKEGKLNLENAVRNLNKPLLIVHGEQDLTVPFEEAKQIYSWSDHSRTELYPISSSGHTYDTKHPFDGNNKKFDLVLNKTNEFFRKHLN
jgi:esterase/lipase